MPEDDLPGHRLRRVFLMGHRMQEGNQLAYLLPKPKQAFLGSVSGLSPRNRSGLNSRGSV